MVKNMHSMSKELEVPNPVSLQMVVLEVSKNEREKALFEKDLHTMGYHGLLERPWNLHDEEMEKELTMAKSSKWDGTL